MFQYMASMGEGFASSAEAFKNAAGLADADAGN
jgi:hypothetical protein